MVNLKIETNLYMPVIRWLKLLNKNQKSFWQIILIVLCEIKFIEYLKWSCTRRTARHIITIHAVVVAVVPIQPWSILNVRGPSYLGFIRSMSWLLMTWLLTSPGHQQPWYWLYKICMSFSYLRKCFKYMCQISVENDITYANICLCSIMII